MKKFIKVSSRKLLVLTLSVIMVLANVVTASAATTVTNQTVYSPMDLFDGSTLMYKSGVYPTFANEGAYDSSVWKFAAVGNGFFVAKTAEIDIASVKTVFGGVQVSWKNVNAAYTVKISDGVNNKEYFTTGTSLLFKELVAGGNYKVQIVADNGKVSDIVSFTNNKALVKLYNEIVPNGTRSHNTLAYFDDNAKSFLDANGALVLKMKTTLDTTKNDEITVSKDDETLTVNANDCYIGANTFIYPTDKQGETYTTTSAEFYSNSGDKHNVFLDTDGNWFANAAQAYRGVHERLYRNNVIDFTDGYIIIPLDDFNVTVDGETVKYNLIDTTKDTGILTVASVIHNYCYSPDGTNVYYNAIKSLTDREISYTEMYVVKDFAEVGLSSSDYQTLDYTVYTADKYTEETVSAYQVLAAEYVKVTKYANLDNHFRFSSDNASSFYNFYCTTNNYTTNTLAYTQRSIEYVMGSEAMAFGFAAQADGTYEISAPLSVTGDNVKYSVYKTDTNGNKTVLQAEQTYTSQDTFCCLQVKLTAGDAVWLSATGDEGAVINIGIPEARLITSETYTYMLTDYMENADVNGLTYATSSATANTKGAWDFGYFNYTADIGATLAAFKNISIPSLKTAEANDAVDTALINAKTPYELIRQGKYYNAVDVNAESVATAASGAGVMSASGNEVTLGFHELSAATTGASLYGHYFEFTSPISGNASLSLGGKVALANQVYMMITVNDVVQTCGYTSITDDNYTFDTDVSAGDKICVYMYSFKIAKQSFSVTPSVMVSAESGYSSVSYDAMGGTTDALNNDFAVNGTEIVLPAATKTGARFNGWAVNGADTVTAAGETITIITDTTLVADYDIYGDLDDNSLVNVSDLAILRKHMVGGAVCERADLAEVSGDTRINICDLVKLRIITDGIAV